MTRPTPRGVALLGVALVTYIAARVFGTWELYLVALAFAGMTAVAWVLVTAASRGLTVDRRVTPAHPVAGDPLRLAFSVDSAWRLPGLHVVLADAGAGMTGLPELVVVEDMGLRRPVVAGPRPARRGVYYLPEFTATVEDPMGLVRRRLKTGRAAAPHGRAPARGARLLCGVLADRRPPRRRQAAAAHARRLGVPGDPPARARRAAGAGGLEVHRQDGRPHAARDGGRQRGRPHRAARRAARGGRIRALPLGGRARRGTRDGGGRSRVDGRLHAGGRPRRQPPAAGSRLAGPAPDAGRREPAQAARGARRGPAAESGPAGRVAAGDPRRPHAGAPPHARPGHHERGRRPRGRPRQAASPRRDRLGGARPGRSAGRRPRRAGSGDPGPSLAAAGVRYYPVASADELRGALAARSGERPARAR